VDYFEYFESLSKGTGRKVDRVTCGECGKELNRENEPEGPIAVTESAGREQVLVCTTDWEKHNPGEKPPHLPWGSVPAYYGTSEDSEPGEN
jgi:hypothetical protein